MKLILNTKLKDFLNHLNLPKSTILLITNFKNVIFSNNKNYLHNNISKDLLIALLQSNEKVNVGFNENLVNIFEDSSKNLKYISQIIFPLKSHNEYCGSIILLNTQNIMNISSINFLNTIKKNVEFYLEENINQTIHKYEFNPLYNNKLIDNINTLAKHYINDLVIDNNYKNIENLLYIKIDTLEDNLEPHNIKLLKEIIDLFEQKKELHTIYGAILGINFKNIDIDINQNIF